MIYLIIKHTFCNLENHLGEALEESILGYFNSFEKAVNFIQIIPDKYTYKGWDNEEYPWYEIKPINCLEDGE